jgi:hypothetical protein
VPLFSIAIFPAFAATIQFFGLPSNTQFGTYNGYAVATVDQLANQPLICDDFDDTTYVPSGKMGFNLSGLIGSNLLEYVRFDSPDPNATLVRYEEAAFLLDGMNHNGPGSLLDLTADYQYALWHLFTPSVALPDTTSQTLLNDAFASVQQGGITAALLYPRLQVYTPTAPYSSNQEFLQLLPAANLRSFIAGADDPTPEPSSAILFGIGAGLIAISAGLKRFQKRRQSTARMDAEAAPAAERYAG